MSDWITVAGQARDVAALVDDVRAYAELAEQAVALAAALRQAGAEAPADPVSLAGFVAQRLDDPAVVAAFDSFGDLRARLVKVRGRIADPNAPWAKLLRPVSAFAEAYTAASEPERGFGFDDGVNRR